MPEYIRQYNKGGEELVEQDVSKVKEAGIKLIQRNSLQSKMEELDIILMR